jgi:aryl-alcohol dehydrogenase-like predicted oxidoreductase
MEYVEVGDSGLRVSKFVLGTLTFGGTHGFAAAGTVGPDEARRLVDIAMDAGVNAFDTANLYSHGDAERVLGHAIEGRRDEVVLTSKVGFPVTDRPNDRGASRIHLLDQVDRSLERLRTDHIDLYFVHLWDGRVPVEETVRTMTELVHAGRIRYWGVSNYSGWSLARTVTLAHERGLIPPVCHQLYYTAEAREAEYELLPAGRALGVASMIWSPLGQGVLTGKVTREHGAPDGTRQAAGDWAEPWLRSRDRLFDVVDALQEVAAERGATIAQVALAWVRDRPNVGSVVIGARDAEQLRENLAAETLELTDGQRARIEAAARPAPIYPFWHRAMHATERASPGELPYLRGHRQTLGLD